MQKCFLLHLLVSGTGVSFFCFFAVIPTVYTKVWQKEGLNKTGNPKPLLELPSQHFPPTGGGKRSSATRNPKPLLELWTSSEAQSLAGGPSGDYALASCMIEDARLRLSGCRVRSGFCIFQPYCSPSSQPRRPETRSSENPRPKPKIPDYRRSSSIE